MKKYSLTEEALGYATAEDQTNTDQRNLVAGSQNVLINRQRKVVSRNGYSRLGSANTTLAPCRSSVTWNTSTGTELLLRVYDDELEVYLGTVDGVVVNAWTRVMNGLSTTEIPRFTTFYDADNEGIDLLLFVQGNANIYRFGGCITTIASTTSNTITKNGTETWAEARVFSAGNKTLLINGTEYTYTGGEGTTTLTGVSPDPTGEADNSVVIQKVVTHSDKPAASRNNHTIGTFQNHVLVGSNDDELVYASKNNNMLDYTYSSPRVPGDGFLLTLDEPSVGFSTLQERLIVFAGKNSIYQGTFSEITVGSTLSETIDIKKYQAGQLQGAQSQETIVPIGNSVLYLSHEPAVRELTSPEQISGGSDPRTLSNPIRPDFDAEDWTNAQAAWFKNAYYLTAPVNSRVYILEFKEDADNTLRRYWQPPQTLPVRTLSPYAGKLYGHSNAVPETYYLFDPDTYSDVNSSDEKLAITAIAKYAYRNFGDRANLKNFDEYFIEGEISPSTTLETTINYDFGGATATVYDEIKGNNFEIVEETLNNASLAQQPLGQQPLGGAIVGPSNTAKFRAIIEIAKEDFFEIQAVFKTDDIDKYFSIIAHGPNAQKSTRQPNNKKI